MPRTMDFLCASVSVHLAIFLSMHCEYYHPQDWPDISTVQKKKEKLERTRESVLYVILKFVRAFGFLQRIGTSVYTVNNTSDLNPQTEIRLLP